VHCRITLTRGMKSTSGMDPRLNVFGTTLIVLPEYKGMVYGDEGIRLVTSAIRRNNPAFLDSKIHHNNLLNNILAKIEANVAGVDDALMLDGEGFIAETNATNVFAFRKGTLVTPTAVACLPGLTRQLVLELARGTNIPVEERRVSLTEFYTAWTYELNGTLRARPGDSGAFDDVAENCNLLSRPVAEAHGLIFLRPEGQAPIDLAETLGGIGDDLGAFKLDSYVHIDTRVHDWDINWKLFFDTFSESYHIRSLHRSSIAPTFNSDCSIFEAFGKNLLSVGLRNNVFDEFAKPEAEWSLLPYGTIQYFLMPNGLVVHQLDHFEVWVVEPIGVNQTRTTTSVYAPQAPATEKARNYFVKNLDLLLSVTGGEDFALMAEIQRTLDAGALPEFLYGRIEPALLHFHAQLDRLLEQDPPAP